MQPAAAIGEGGCPVCSGRNLWRSVEFDALPILCNDLHADMATAKRAETGRFVTTFCRDCEHLFNAAFDEKRISYAQSYENSLHYSPRFVEFSEALAARLNRRYALCGKSVVDIGCGKGDFLKRLCALSGAVGWGFDKSFEESRGDPTLDITFVNDWFGDGYADIRPDMVLCRHVLEHIADPVSFLRQLREHPGVTDQTVFYFEVPNALYTLRDLGIWDLTYEHVSYFTPGSLQMAFMRAGFDILETGASFGEQYLYIEAKVGVERPVAPNDGNYVDQLVQSFDNAYREKVDYWRDYLALRDPSQTVVWGAGSKGITFVNVVPGADLIATLVDVNPHKQGRFVPRTGARVVSKQALTAQPVQSIIIMNGLYREEIATEVASLGLSSEIVVA
jgi:SAM-dependent methyltransferase